MSSLEESRRQVRDHLERESEAVSHEDILASLQDEIDKHNAATDGLRDAIRRSRSRSRSRNSHETPPTKFRFKDGKEPRKRKHRSEHGRSHRKSQRRDRTASIDSEAAHPFPREPVEPDYSHADPITAFQESLFDALGNDEGAQYWADVYSQPIHVYSRPNVENSKGELEQMSDAQYAAYVKTKMWERKHPEIVQAKAQAAKQKREEEEEQTRRREDFIRRKEQAAWDRAQRKGAGRHAGADDDGHEYAFAGEVNSTNGKRENDAAEAEYSQAWTRYLEAWDKLKHDLLAERTTSTTPAHASKRIPWPVLDGKPVVKPNIEAFIRHIPTTDDQRTRLARLKIERVRWHPDKVQQRFAGNVDEGTMKLVTGVFQIVDSFVEAERLESG